MRINQITLKLKRTLRYKPYVISEPTAELVGVIFPGDNIPAAVEELEEDIQILMDRICVTEISKFKEREDAIECIKR